MQDLASQIQWICRHSPQEYFGGKTAQITAVLDKVFVRHIYHRESSARFWCEKLLEMQEEVIFLKLADEWQKDTCFLSSITHIAEHPAYREIIGMGQKAIPFILDDLKRTHADWFTALQSITGQNPVQDEDRGNMKAMVNAWIEWGKRNA